MNGSEFHGESSAASSGRQLSRTRPPAKRTLRRRWACPSGLLAVLMASGLPAVILGAESTAPPGATAAARSSESDVIQFLDGASLHGRLRSVDTEHGVQWDHPAAKKPIKFRPTSLAWVKFENPQRVTAQFTPTCWFQFNNGDEIFGGLKSLDADKLALETWFGGNLEAPRQALQSITLFSKGYSILYEGPKGTDGWKLLRDAKGWQYRDGAFVASSVGILGRDLHLTGSSSVEFDLAWTGHFSLSFILYTEVFDRFDYSMNSYMFHLAPGYLSLQRVQAGAGVLSLGPQALIPDMTKKNKVRLQIRTNKEEATIGVWADGELVHRWKDPSGFVGRGTGIVYSSQLEGPSIKLSNFRVAEWDGSFEPRSPTNAPPNQDLVYLLNRDKVSGALKQIREGKLSVSTPQTSLDIPLERITQIFLNQPAAPVSVSKPWEIRVDVSGGGAVAFELEKWDEQKVTGTSVHFGRMSVNPKSIRQIQFNLGRSVASGQEKEFVGEESWELDE